MLALRHGHTSAKLIDLCLSLDSLLSAESLHALLLKLGLLRHTFAGNRLLYLYSRLAAPDHALQAFRDVPFKNTFTYNILLKALFDSGRVDVARQLFEAMPARDSVSWNSAIAGFARSGFADEALELVYKMRKVGVRATGFTYSIAASCVLSVAQAKQVHASVVRSRLVSSNTVTANSLVHMYGRLGLVGYACSVFNGIEIPDVISWNSVISVCGGSGQECEALECFWAMRDSGIAPDAYTMSAMFCVCTDLEDLVKGEQLLAWSFKVGYLSNCIVSSAIIDMYSTCGRMDDAVQLFEEMVVWNSTICNSMISGYARNGLVHEALKLFVMILRMDIRPTEFTFASILGSSSSFGLAEQGTGIHCWVVKFGLEADMVITSGLMDMYLKLGLVDAAMRIFSAMNAKDLVSWNALIIGLAQNGQGITALSLFRQLQNDGLRPDRITLLGALSACAHEGLTTEGNILFSLMEEKYGITRGVEHFACVVDMLGRAGMLREAMEIIETMPYKPSESVWRLLLEACRIHGEFKFAELVANKFVELEPHSPLPYYILARIFATRGRWDSVARVWRGMKERGLTKVRGCSWINIKNQIFVFKSEQILHLGGNTMYSMLHLLALEMEKEGYIPGVHAAFGNGEEE